MQKYAINEVFESIQGEGEYTGRPAIFIRLQGCDVGCAWCDTKHSWLQDKDKELSVGQLTQKREESDTWSWFTQEQLFDLLLQRGYQAKLVVLTGGEPAAVDLQALSSSLIAAGFKVQLETSGTYEINIHSDAWVTVSPKLNMKGKLPILTSALLRANEIKHPVATEKDIDNLKELLTLLPKGSSTKVCLQPISCKPRATQLAITHCIKENWRLSVQLHKYLGVE